MKKNSKCGTTAGWNAHTKRREEPCEPCRHAKAIYTKQWRHRTGRSTSRLYSPEDIQAVKAQALEEAVAAFPLETITAPDNAVVWMMRRAEQLRSQAA